MAILEKPKIKLVSWHFLFLMRLNDYPGCQWVRLLRSLYKTSSNKLFAKWFVLLLGGLWLITWKITLALLCWDIPLRMLRQHCGFILLAHTLSFRFFGIGTKKWLFLYQNLKWKKKKNGSLNSQFRACFPLSFESNKKWKPFNFVSINHVTKKTGLYTLWDQRL